MSSPDAHVIIENRSLEEKFDPEMRFRPLPPATAWLVAGLLLTLSFFHYYTAGFGLLREATHRGIHMAFVLGLIFLVFSAFKSGQERIAPSSWWRPGSISLVDWALAVAAAASSLYVPWIFNELAFRVGNPSPTDVVMGTILIVVLLEATRRSVGWPLPVIAIGVMLYAYFGPSMPGILQHPGASWSNIVNHLYLTSQGIYGIALGVVATYVFHYVLFGVLATRVGLGKLFIDLATCVAGRFAGGPAKVSIFGSALFGMISGSSIANTVTVGSLTIPAMIRVGYKRHFAAAVESAASTGGQITPPIMGAAAFLMVEFLNVSYRTVILAALVPALMHFFGVFMQVHLEAKRAGLKGLPAEELPKAAKVLREGWQTIMPLAVLLIVLFSGFTPYLAAFWGITACLVVGASRVPAITLGFLAAIVIAIATGMLTQLTFSVPLLGLVLALLVYTFVKSEAGKALVLDLVDAFVVGAKYAIGVGAAAATVGIIVGIVTLTGVGFKISFIVTSFAAQLAQIFMDLVPAGLADMKGMTLFFTLVMTAVVCILLGCGVPTTANYIIMVTVAAPALGLLGVQPLVAHFFVFYYGVLADITPPVALAAYAGASMAGADPFKTGNTAFRLGLGKALVPFVFVYGPAMLIVTPEFTWASFLFVTAGAVIGIMFLSAAFAGYALTPMRAWERWLIGFASLPIIAPDVQMTLMGLAMAVPVVVSQLLKARGAMVPRPA
ncbi:TRAP transporter permease [Microvirga lotononidis]|uniref:TRAP transporter, 4TM/12TM fusion protein n=1 Tax=Microvirga lotononidis TaxID=864069 RepID=I4YTI0_9HYPH|nr:TRAP transporter permease [Microvirga lotononidis]EIM27272.1 TRAP transporter, 4TM/12TM fusion protein [Microvirga lotononidis]WQO28556.1 TRAP transporter permease [Microvirga lotononidis]